MLEGKSILLVDDDLTLLEMYENRLKAEGALVEMARDGEEAIKMIEANHPDLIMLDIMMPKVNGFQVLQYLKNDQTLRDIPVIVLTVLVEGDKYTKAKELGADDFIVKSDLMPMDVIEKIRNLLASKTLEVGEPKD